MQRTYSKFLASLLALLLAVTPLQGLMAASVVSDSAADAHVMMVDGEPMHHAANEMAAGSEPCEMADCCNGDNCVMGHCVTCVVAMFTSSYSLISIVHESYESWFSVQYLQQNSASLFRPPKA